MEKNVLEILKRVVTDFGDPLILLSICLVVFFAMLFLISWHMTKRRFSRDGHQVPGGVVKEYLDSVIDNSTNLRSSLFREKKKKPVALGVSSVRGLGEKPVDGSSRGLNELQEQLAEREKTIEYLEGRIAKRGSGKEDGKQLNDEISDLKKKLASYDKISQERDELKKNLHQLTEQSASRSAQSSDDTTSSGDTGGGEAAFEEQADSSSEEDEVVVEYADNEALGENKEKEKENGKKDEKTSDRELMDEFEKMLG